MPRVADHDQRRELIARAFQQQVGAHGLAPTTFTRVADAAGVSVGLIQHYFAGKDDLLRFAWADCLHRRDRRIADVVEDGEAAHRPIREILGLALRELLPLDAARRQEHHVVQHLQALALHDVELAELVRAADSGQHLRISVAVTNGTRCGEVEPDVDPDAAAAVILSMTYGIATRTAFREDQAGVVAVLDPVLAAVFTGRCRHHDDAP